MEMVARLFRRTQPDPVSPAPTQPQIRAVISFPPMPSRDLADCLDDIEAVRRLVQRSSAAQIQRIVRLVAAQNGEAL